MQQVACLSSGYTHSLLLLFGQGHRGERAEVLQPFVDDTPAEPWQDGVRRRKRDSPDARPFPAHRLHVSSQSFATRRAAAACSQKLTCRVLFRESSPAPNY